MARPGSRDDAVVTGDRRLADPMRCPVEEPGNLEVTGLRGSVVASDSATGSDVGTAS